MMTFRGERERERERTLSLPLFEALIIQLDSVKLEGKGVEPQKYKLSTIKTL